MLPEHHLIIANAGGVYVEIETGADCHYEPAGLHRVHMDTCGAGAPGSCVRVNPLLVTSAGPPCGAGGEGGSGGPIAVGPWWAVEGAAPGARTLLADHGAANVSAVTLAPAFTVNSTRVSFGLSYELHGDGAVVTQRFDLTVGADGAAPTVAVTNSVSLTGPAPARLTRFGLQLPLFVFDGATNVTAAVDAAANTATVSAPGWGSAAYAVTSTRNISWTADAAPPHVTRNGLMTQVFVETAFSTEEPDIVLSITGANA